MPFMMRLACAFTKLPPRRIGCERPFSTRPAEAPVSDDAIRCDACPVLCYIKPGRTGSCDRYGNQNGQLVRLDPHVVLDRTVGRGESVVPFIQRSQDWDGTLVSHAETFVTAIGAGTTYPDYKPAPFIISSQVEGVDVVTVVTEGILDRKSTRLNSSHVKISYAVF